MFLILKCLNIKFKKLLLPVFSFQITLFNTTFINMFKTVGPTPTWLDHMRKLALFSNNNNNTFTIFFSFNIYIYIYIYTKHTIMFFSHFKICYLKHGTKQIFLYYEYFKHVFSQHFSNHNFHIILNNNTWNLLPNRPLACSILQTYIKRKNRLIGHLLEC